MNPSGLEALMAFMNSDIGQLLKNIVVNEVVPFAKQKFINGAMNPVTMTQEEQTQRAQQEFATVDIPEDGINPESSQPEQNAEDLDSSTY